MTALARAVPCALDRRDRKVRAVVATLALGAFVLGTPLVVALAVVRAASGSAITRDSAGLGRADVVALLVALTAICMWLPGAVAVVGELRRRNRPVRPSRLVPPSIRRILAGQIEASLLGAGTLAGWTSTRVDGSFDDLERPGRRRGAMIDLADDSDDATDANDGDDAFDPDGAEDPAGAGVADPDGSQPVAAPPGARRRLTTASPLRNVKTRAYLVQRGDTWWGLAERFAGDGRRFAELKELNLGRRQPDGTVVERDAVLRAGWTIEVPRKAVSR